MDLNARDDEVEDDVVLSAMDSMKDKSSGETNNNPKINKKSKLQLFTLLVSSTLTEAWINKKSR